MATRDPVLADVFFIRRSATSIVRALDIDHTLEDPESKLDTIAAAQLFILCPRELFERCQAEDSVEGLDRTNIIGTPLWEHDILKLSVERWVHWRIRWQTIKHMSGVSNEFHNVAVSSLEAMDIVM